MPHPNVFWYGLNGMCAQKKKNKKGLVTLSSYIFYVKSQSNIVYEYFKTKIVSRDTIIPPQVHWTLATVIGGGFGYH